MTFFLILSQLLFLFLWLLGMEYSIQGRAAVTRVRQRVQVRQDKEPMLITKVLITKIKHLWKPESIQLTIRPWLTLQERNTSLLKNLYCAYYTTWWQADKSLPSDVNSSQVRTCFTILVPSMSPVLNAAGAQQMLINQIKEWTVTIFKKLQNGCN